MHKATHDYITRMYSREVNALDSHASGRCSILRDFNFFYFFLFFFILFPLLQMSDTRMHTHMCKLTTLWTLLLEPALWTLGLTDTVATFWSVWALANSIAIMFESVYFRSVLNFESYGNKALWTPTSIVDTSVSTMLVFTRCVCICVSAHTLPPRHTHWSK